MNLWVVERKGQLDFLESNHLMMALAKRQLQTSRQLLLKSLISTIVARLESKQEGVMDKNLALGQCD